MGLWVWSVFHHAHGPLEERIRSWTGKAVLIIEPFFFFVLWVSIIVRRLTPSSDLIFMGIQWWLMTSTPDRCGWSSVDHSVDGDSVCLSLLSMHWKAGWKSPGPSSIMAQAVTFHAGDDRLRRQGLWLFLIRWVHGPAPLLMSCCGAASRPRPGAWSCFVRTSLPRGSLACPRWTLH